MSKSHTFAAAHRKFDEVIATGNTPRAIRMYEAVGSICRYISGSIGPDYIQIGSEAAEQIDNIEKPTKEQEEEFVSILAGMCLGKYMVQESAYEMRRQKDLLLTKYEQCLFELVNLIRVFQQTRFQITMQPLAPYWRNIETRPGTAILERWYLDGNVSAADDEEMCELFDDIQYVSTIAGAADIAKKIAAKYPHTDAPEDLGSYRNPLDTVDSEDEEPEEGGATSGGAGFTPKPMPVKEDTGARQFKRSPTPKEVEGKGLIDFWKKGHFPSKITRKPPVDRIERVKKVIEPIFEAKRLYVPTPEPRPRLDRRFLAMGQKTGLHTFSERATFSRGNVDMNIIFDCSGSMSSAVNDGRVLLHALNDLAKQGYIKGYVFFASGEGYCVRKFPMESDEINSVSAFSGSEGIESVLRHQTAFLKRAKLNLCYTDAQITDTEWNKEDYAKKGVKLVGLYVGDESARTRMNEYFVKSILKPNVEELAYSILYELKSTPMIRS